MRTDTTDLVREECGVPKGHVDSTTNGAQKAEIEPFMPTSDVYASPEVRCRANYLAPAAAHRHETAPKHVEYLISCATCECVSSTVEPEDVDDEFVWERVDCKR